MNFPSISTLPLGPAHSLVATALSSICISDEGTWLRNSNPYLIGGSKQVKSDCKQASANGTNLTEYLAASCFTHCADSWSYIGRAIDCLLKGDGYSSAHLAYYAELRSAASILATQGIFLGNGYSCIVDQNGSYTQLSDQGTHTAAWDLITSWFNTQECIDLIGEIVMPGGVKLNEWVAQVPGGTNPAILDMLRGVSFDLDSFRTDRTRRNRASYEPTTLMPSFLDAAMIKSTIETLWLEIEPHNGGDFPGIDRSILANILQTQYIGQVQPVVGSNVINVADWAQWIGSIIPASLENSAFSTVLRGDPCSHEFQAMLGTAFQNDISDLAGPDSYISPMLGRATILARLATGACLLLLDEAGRTTAELVQWSANLSRNRGIIPDCSLPDPPTDLIADLETPRQYLADASSASLYQLLRDLKESATVLGQTERVVAWTFA